MCSFTTYETVGPRPGPVDAVEDTRLESVCPENGGGGPCCRCAPRREGLDLRGGLEVTVMELIKLLGVGALGSFHLAVECRPSAIMSHI